MYLYFTWVADDGLDFYCVYEGFTESNVLDAGIVEAVDIVPDYEAS